MDRVTHEAPDSAHTSRPWRIHEIAPDFRLEDVWALPTPGGPDDFPRLVQAARLGRPVAAARRRPSRALFAIRWKLGALLGWDRRGRRPRRAGPDAAATGCPPTCATPPPARTSRAPVHPAVPDRRRVGRGDRQPDRARRRCTSAGSADGDGGHRGQMAVLVQAQRPARRAPTWPRSRRSATCRLPGDGARHRARLAGVTGRRRDPSVSRRVAATRPRPSAPPPRR